MPEWVTTQEAAKILNVTVQYLHQPDELCTITRKLRSPLATTARGIGYLWKRDDLLAINAIRRKCRLRFREALRVWNMQQGAN